MGYVMQQYDETGEYHLFKAHYNIERTSIIIENLVPLCGDSSPKFDKANSLEFNSKVLEEDEMARQCACMKSSVRHQICAKCVEHFYKTK